MIFLLVWSDWSGFLTDTYAAMATKPRLAAREGEVIWDTYTQRDRRLSSLVELAAMLPKLLTSRCIVRMRAPENSPAGDQDAYIHLLFPLSGGENVTNVTKIRIHIPCEN